MRQAANKRALGKMVAGRKTGMMRGDDARLEQYMAEVAHHPVLDRAEERRLAERYRAQNDVVAAHRLVVANLRFVVKVAHTYARYGLRLLDLVQEGNIGLMVAVKRFDPARGYRLITYAVWWIRAHIQSFIMRSWSLVRLGATRLHRKLFFRLPSLRAEAERRAASGEGQSASAPDVEAHEDLVWGVDAAYRQVADELGTSPRQAAEVGRRLAARDYSLDVQIGEGGDAPSHLDRLPAQTASQEEALAGRQEAKERRALVADALGQLDARERGIVEERVLGESPPTLGEIGKRLGVSRERVRQVEARALAKLRRHLAPALAG